MPSKRYKRSIANPSQAFWLLGDETRWKIVRILLSGPQATRHLAAATGKKRELVSKHIQQLLTRGLIQRSEKRAGDGRLEYFELVPKWQVEGDPLVLDFGECQVRFGKREKVAPPVTRTGSALPKRI
jgi:DNA-binding HxlR family transcriptional regulator